MAELSGSGPELFCQAGVAVNETLGEVGVWHPRWRARPQLASQHSRSGRWRRAFDQRADVATPEPQVAPCVASGASSTGCCGTMLIALARCRGRLRSPSARIRTSVACDSAVCACESVSRRHRPGSVLRRPTDLAGRFSASRAAIERRLRAVIWIESLQWRNRETSVGCRPASPPPLPATGAHFRDWPRERRS